MTNITTLVSDINAMLVDPNGYGIDKDNLANALSSAGTGTALALHKSLSGESKTRDKGVVYATEVGTQCDRQLWYRYHAPSLGGGLSGSTIVKFTYGHIIEEVVLTLAKAAGHSVTDEQRSVTLTHPYSDYTIRGRMDAVIDGTIVDVKSTTSFGFKDFAAGKGGEKFGYKQQLGFYSHATNNPNKGFLYINRDMGHIGYVDEKYVFEPNYHFERLNRVLSAVGPEEFPTLDAVPHNTDGSLKLGTTCSYCAFKKDCWKESNGGKGLRAFNYAGKPAFLVHIVKSPSVPEIEIA